MEPNFMTVWRAKRKQRTLVSITHMRTMLISPVGIRRVIRPRG
jgi:hypothetical protein